MLNPNEAYDIQCQISAMKVILSRVHALCADVETTGMADAAYREIQELRHFVSEHCRLPQTDLLLKEHKQLLFEIGA